MLEDPQKDPEEALFESTQKELPQCAPQNTQKVPYEKLQKDTKEKVLFRSGSQGQTGKKPHLIGNPRQDFKMSCRNARSCKKL